MPRQKTRSKLPDSIRSLIERRIECGLELPLFPATAAELMQLGGDETCGAERFARILERDQSLAVHILGVANSAAHAPKEPIVSLQQAVSRLGLPTIVESAIALSLKGRVFCVPGHEADIRAMWMRSAAAAVYGREAARLLRKNVEAAFLCGLLHEVGRPIVLQVFVDIAREVTDQAVPPALLGLAIDEFHQRVGALTVEKWQLAPWVKEAVMHHHDHTGVTDHADEVMITTLAHLCASWVLDEEATDKSDFPAEHSVVGDLNLYGDDLMSLLDMRGQVLEIVEAFA